MDTTEWMPPSMDQADKDAFAASHPDDPHRAAQTAWETYAATLPTGDAEGVHSVSTGAQSVTYANGSGPRGVALGRAAWHASRARVYSVQVGPDAALAAAGTSAQPENQAAPRLATGADAPIEPRSLPSAHHLPVHEMWGPVQP